MAPHKNQLRRTSPELPVQSIRAFSVGRQIALMFSHRYHKWKLG